MPDNGCLSPRNPVFVQPEESTMHLSLLPPRQQKLDLSPQRESAGPGGENRAGLSGAARKLFPNCRLVTMEEVLQEAAVSPGPQIACTRTHTPHIITIIIFVRPSWTEDTTQLITQTLTNPINLLTLT